MTDNKSLKKIVEGSEIINPSDPYAIFSPKGLEQALAVANHLLKSGALPPAYRTPEAVLVGIQAGRELGMKPIEALQGLLPINGQMKIWGDALTGRVTRNGYKFKWGKCDETIATVSLIDPEGKESSQEVYKIEEAKKANLLGKQNWRSYTYDMLRRKAMARVVKYHAPHLLQGISGFAEDSDDVDFFQGEFTQPIAQDNASKVLEKKSVEIIEKAEEGQEPMTDEQVEERVETVDTEVADAKTETTTPGEVKNEEGKTPEQIADEMINEDDVVEGEIEEEKEMTVGEISDEVKRIKNMIVLSKSKEEEVLKYYKVEKLEDMTTKQGVELCAMLRKKKETIDNAKTESPAAKKMREAKEAQKNKTEEEKKVSSTQPTQGIPEDVCQYLNSLEGIDEASLPGDIMLLKLDASKGTFRNYSAYPSLRGEIEKMNKGEIK